MARWRARESIQTAAGAERQINRIERRSGNNNARNRSVQQVTLVQGRARVSACIGDKACADGLSDAERAARATRRGLRADPNFAPLSAKNCTKLHAELGRFALVVGEVLSVRESGTTIDMDFGRVWTQNFTVIIPQRMARTFAAAGVAPKTLVQIEFTD